MVRHYFFECGFYILGRVVHRRSDSIKISPDIGVELCLAICNCAESMGSRICKFSIIVKSLVYKMKLANLFHLIGDIFVASKDIAEIKACCSYIVAKLEGFEMAHNTPVNVAHAIWYGCAESGVFYGQVVAAFMELRIYQATIWIGDMTSIHNLKGVRT